MSKYRKEVLAIFKQLHVTRQKLFQGDEPNLAKARAKINEEFKNHKIVKSEDEIPELIDVAKQVEHFYRTQVVQAVQVGENKHRLVIREDTEKLDNKEFDEKAKLPKQGRAKQCCKKPE
ncbi:complex III assembly factor LYRM7 [Sitodiplosis mosellana]|uniref:complex III assembly factor LYRM7 n=1 Tax=Sitodiplosis mosellana TaxID=263140 RepID=UPI00244466FE|nr:complex III assembly factor LYRM7 [Sitodiplosis mosellana]